MPQRIVCLDGHTLNPGDLSWSAFEKLGSMKVYDRTPCDQILARAAGASCVLTNKTPLDAATIDALKDLRYIGVLATGYNIVDLAAADRRKIPVTNVPTYGTDSVAQHTISLILELARRNSLHEQAVRQGQWTSCPDFCFALTPIVELTGKTLGLVGVGRIGLAVARIAASMGMRIVAFDPAKGNTAEVKVEFVSMEQVFAQADVVSLHCPLTTATQNLVNAARLATMKRSAFIVNTSRGPLIDESALAQALNSGHIAGAALDVLPVEPPPANNPLIGAPNCIVTPHIAWYAIESRQRLMDVAGENLRSFLAGKPVNVVNRP